MWANLYTLKIIIFLLYFIEVLSPSTEMNDRGLKFQAYRTIPTLQEYLLVTQDSIRIEHFKRQNEVMWLMMEYTTPQETIELSSVSCILTVADLYERVVFQPH